MSSSHTVLRYLHLTHLYIGVSSLPHCCSSLSPGPLQTFSLHVGLFVSTLSGLYMSYKYIRNRRLITTILLAGIIVPVVLTIF
jgi:hypothetical protein